MALDQLLAALERDAQAEADRILAEARSDAAAREARTEALLAERRSRLLDEREAQREAELEGELAAARLTARRHALAARETVLDRVFAAAQGACAAAASDPAYHATLVPRLERALACFAPGSRLTISASPPLVPEITRWSDRPADTAVIADPQLGTGFRIAGADGSLEVLDTLEASLIAGRISLARLALALLELPS